MQSKKPPRVCAGAFCAAGEKERLPVARSLAARKRPKKRAFLGRGHYAQTAALQRAQEARDALRHYGVALVVGMQAVGDIALL